MSVRPSLFVCAALLAALLAPPASAKPAEMKRDSAQRPATASHVRPDTKAATRSSAAAPAASRPTAAAATRPGAVGAGRKDMTSKTGSAAKAGVRSDTGPTTTRTTAVDGRGPAATRRGDVIDGRDTAAIRELYRKRRPTATAKAEPVAGQRGARVDTGRVRGDAPAATRGRGEIDAARPAAATRGRREVDAGRGPARAGARADAGDLREAPATSVVADPADIPATAAAPAAAASVLAHTDRSDMAKKTGPKNQRQAAAADDEPVVATGPRPTPTSSCAAGLGAAPALQFDRTRATLREFSWADMAYFFETAPDESEPEPRQVAREGTLPAEEAIRRSGLPRKALDGLATARAVDLLTERELVRIDKALSGASPAAIATLLQADSPSLRAHVWTWLASTPAGACALVKLDGREVDAAIRDRSVAVEHGEDLVFRPLGDYALAARTRVAAADPQAFDALLRSLAADATVDSRVRALVAGLRVRRGHADSLESGLRDPAASVRGATAAAAIDRDRARYEARVLDHAADDPADLVTELIVGELLGGPDGVPRGELAERRDERVMAAVSRWRGRGDPLAPLPMPEQPLRFPALKKIEAAPAPAPAPMLAATPAPAPTRAAEPEAAPTPTAEAPEPEGTPEPAAVRPLAHTPARRDADIPAGPRLPSVTDDPDGAPLRP